MIGVCDPYTRRKRTSLYENPWIAVEAHEIVHPSGEPGEHVLILTPQSCGVIVEDRGDVLFTRQPRFAARRHVIEIVKGGCAQDETPLECAKRELREELGITAAQWSELGTLREIPSIVEMPLALFVAREIEFGPHAPAAEESITLVRLHIPAALEAAASGDIDDAVTVAALFRYARVCLPTSQLRMGVYQG